MVRYIQNPGGTREEGDQHPGGGLLRGWGGEGGTRSEKV